MAGNTAGRLHRACEPSNHDRCCRALLAKYRHEDNECLQAATLARRDPSVAPEATLLMVQTYLQPLVDALWAGEATDASDVISVVSTCDHLLYSLDAGERTSTRWLVRCVPMDSCARPGSPWRCAAARPGAHKVVQVVQADLCRHFERMPMDVAAEVSVATLLPRFPSAGRRRWLCVTRVPHAAVLHLPRYLSEGQAGAARIHAVSRLSRRAHAGVAAPGVEARSHRFTGWATRHAASAGSPRARKPTARTACTRARIVGHACVHACRSCTTASASSSPMTGPRMRHYRRW